MGVLFHTAAALVHVVFGYFDVMEYGASLLRACLACVYLLIALVVGLAYEFLVALRQVGGDLVFSVSQHLSTSLEIHPGKRLRKHHRRRG